MLRPKKNEAVSRQAQWRPATTSGRGQPFPVSHRHWPGGARSRRPLSWGERTAQLLTGGATTCHGGARASKGEARIRQLTRCSIRRPSGRRRAARVSSTGMFVTVCKEGGYAGEPEYTYPVSGSCTRGVLGHKRTLRGAYRSDQRREEEKKYKKKERGGAYDLEVHIIVMENGGGAVDICDLTGNCVRLQKFTVRVASLCGHRPPSLTRLPSCPVIRTSGVEGTTRQGLAGGRSTEPAMNGTRTKVLDRVKPGSFRMRYPAHRSK